VTAVAVLGRSVQLIVVNNNCTDDTESVVETISKRIAVTYVHEPRGGLANARNAATLAAEGDYIIWTDDDVMVSARWLEAYAQAFAEHPHAAFYGGPIRPVFEPAPPAWLAAGWRYVAWIYAARDLGEHPRRITRYHELPYGANFAIRLDLQRHIRYDPRLGRQPANYWLGAEETEVLSRLLDERRDGRWVPAAQVLHCISRDRQRLTYVARHAFGSGQSKEMRQPTSSRRLLFGRPLWLWAKWTGAVGRFGIAAATGRAEEWLPAMYRAAEMSGRLYVRIPGSSTLANKASSDA
jgi:glycosyltransferase involved in cell wall biosynthesis